MTDPIEYVEKALNDTIADLDDEYHRSDGVLESMVNRAILRAFRDFRNNLFMSAQ